MEPASLSDDAPVAWDGPVDLNKELHVCSVEDGRLRARIADARRGAEDAARAAAQVEVAATEKRYLRSASELALRAEAAFGAADILVARLGAASRLVAGPGSEVFEKLVSDFDAWRDELRAVVVGVGGVRRLGDILIGGLHAQASAAEAPAGSAGAPADGSAAAPPG